MTQTLVPGNARLGFLRFGTSERNLGHCDLLEVTELEGDLLKASLAVNSEKLVRLYKKILHAKHALAEVGSDQIVFNYLRRGRNRNALPV